MAEVKEMADSEVKEEMIDTEAKEEIKERMKTLKIDDHVPSPSGDQILAMKTKMLHHLVEFSKVFQKSASERDMKEMAKNNSELISELLNWPIKPTASTSTSISNDPLMQKLIDAKVDLTDPTVKDFMNKQFDDLVRNVQSFARGENKVMFELDARRATNPTNQLCEYQGEIYKTLFLHGLTFAIRLWSFPIDLEIVCHEIPKNLSCRARIEVAVRNEAGQKVWNRAFGKIFSQASYLSMNDLIQKEEYADESLGLTKDGKLIIELVIRAEKPVEFKQDSQATKRVCPS